jgi:hypothetical protein
MEHRIWSRMATGSAAAAKKPGEEGEPLCASPNWPSAPLAVSHGELAVKRFDYGHRRDWGGQANAGLSGPSVVTAWSIMNWGHTFFFFYFFILGAGWAFGRDMLSRRLANVAWLWGEQAAAAAVAAAAGPIAWAFWPRRAAVSIVGKIRGPWMDQPLLKSARCRARVCLGLGGGEEL